MAPPAEEGRRVEPRARIHRRAKRVDDDGDIDDFLHARAGERRQTTERGNDHRRGAEPEADPDTLTRDTHRPPADRYCFVHSVERIHEEDDVGCLRGDAAAVCCQRDANVGRRERGRVVDAVADHHHHVPLMPQPFDELDFAGGQQIAVCFRNACALREHVHDRLVIARQKYQTSHAAVPQRREHGR